MKQIQNKRGVLASAQSGWLVLLWLVLLGGCHPKQPTSPAYRYLVVADIEGCDSCQAKLYIRDYTTLKDIDTITAPHGRFALQGTITQPGLYITVKSTKRSLVPSISICPPTQLISGSRARRFGASFTRSPFRGPI